MSIVASLERSLATNMNLKELDVQPYGGLTINQDLEIVPTPNDYRLSLKGNGFRKVDFRYDITDKTILEFEFRSDGEGARQGIGFDNDNGISWKKIFQLYGSKSSKLSAFNNYRDTAGKWKYYQIPVGQFFQGNVSYLTFVNQQGKKNNTSSFKNIKIYEGTAETVKKVTRMIDSPPSPVPVAPIEDVMTLPNLGEPTMEEPSIGPEPLVGPIDNAIDPTTAPVSVQPGPSNAGLPAFPPSPASTNDDVTDTPGSSADTSTEPSSTIDTTEGSMPDSTDSSDLGGSADDATEESTSDSTDSPALEESTDDATEESTPDSTDSPVLEESTDDATEGTAPDPTDSPALGESGDDTIEESTPDSTDSPTLGELGDDVTGGTDAPTNPLDPDTPDVIGDDPTISDVPLRDPLKQPFASTSIWNMPIGSNAQYVDAQLEWLKSAVVDEDHFYALDSNDPLQPVLNPGTWGPGRGTGTEFRNIALPLANDLVVADATSTQTPNNASAFLMPNGRTLVQLNPLSRDRPGGFVSGYRSSDEDIYGSGIRGGHAGSGLSSIGGTIRKGELTSDEPIRHALKVNLPAELTLSYTQGQGGGLGYRWPATRADLYANPETYGGGVSGLMMGSLLALPPDATPESLGIETEVGRKLFHAFQDYGAYVADDVLAPAYAIEMEHGVTTEIEETYGHALTGWDNYQEGDLYEDYMRLFTSLHVIENNGPDNIGGGGTPRVELAPELDDSGYPLFEGTSEDDIANGDDAPDTMYGEDGKDTLQGNGGSDFIEGGEGNDTIDGGADNDHLFGDNGADHVMGGDGNDYVDGGWWHDHLEGGAGDDMLSGWQGDDIIDGGEGFDTLMEALSRYFSDADFTLTNTKLTGSGIDQLTSIEHAILLGGDGDNTIDASGFTRGTVYLDGGLGTDVLIGTPNADTFSASVGNDQLTGGAGGDRFSLTSRITLLTSKRPNPLNTSNFDGLSDFNFVAGDSPASVGNAQRGYVTINDFNVEEGDVIELKGSADQYVLGSSPATTSGQAIYLDQDGNGQVSTNDALVAVVKGQQNMNLQSPSFDYFQ